MPRDCQIFCVTGRRWAAVLAFVCLLAGVPAVPAGAQDEPAGVDVEGLAGLAGAQEALLNAYRCSFDVDVEVVRGGCVDGAPAVAVEPWGGGVVDLAALGRLVADQEALLNAYRCRFGVDTQVVPGGCANGLPVARPAAGPAEGDEAGDLEVSGEDLVDCSASQHCLVSLSGRSASGRWCGLRDDQTVMCTDPHGFAPLSWAGHVPVEGRFTSVSAGRDLACGVRVDQTVQCWSYNWQFESAFSPEEGRFTSVSAGIDWSDFACGIREDRTAACWGDDRHGRLDAPGGRFLSVSAGWEHACGIKEDHTVVCWGDNKHGRLEAPEGRFLSVSAGFWFSCGIREDRSATCWGNNLRRGYNAPPGRFQSVSAGQGLACGLRDNGTAVCWGPPGSGTFGELDVPTGQFASVSAGSAYGCGLRPDGTVECWGDTTATAWPSSDSFYASQCYWCDGPTRTTGEFEVHVFYCARNGKYTQADLEYETDQINQTIAPFYAQESGDLARIEFIPAGITSPDIDWRATTISSEDSSKEFFNPRIIGCLSEIQYAPPQTDPWHVLILMDAAIGEAYGYAYGRFWMMDKDLVGRAATLAEAATIESLSDWFDRNRWACLSGADCDQQYVYWRYLAVVAHELGHSLFDFGHPQDCSLMSIGNDIGCQPVSWATAMQTSNPLQARFFIGCTSRQKAGWPLDPNRCPEDP